MARDFRGIRALAEREQLHEQPLVGALRLAVFQAPLLAEIGWLDARASFVHDLTTLSARRTSWMRERMLVYRDGGRRVESARELARLRARAAAASSDDAAVGLLIEAGEFESAVADAVEGTSDARDLTLRLREATLAAARGWMGTMRDASTQAALERVDTRMLPQSVSLRVSEGYAYYALYPETYALSARRFFEQRQPSAVTVIGIRSIGTSLSAVVAAALERCGCDVRTHTVRPRGHPFDRQLTLDESLSQSLLDDARRGAMFAIVDEGPGLSGSSFASVIGALRSLGIEPSSIVLFPSWDPDPAMLKSEPARRAWREHARYCASATDAGVAPDRAFGMDEPLVDFSGGRWRETLLPAESEWPAVHQQHERWKAFAPSARRLFKFAGIGPYGEAARARADALAAHGLHVPPGRLRNGFLELPFLEGTPVRGSGASAEEAASIGTYIGSVSRLFPPDAVANVESLQAMIEHNVGALTGPLALDLPRDVPAMAIDGRILAHEWIRTRHGLHKVDALDHHRDHFFPGLQSPAWDLAAACVEFEMPTSQQHAMMAAFEVSSGDGHARRLLPFYSLAYAAFRVGYTRLAADTLNGNRDGARFARDVERYSQCALNAAACFSASSKSPLKQIARSSMNT